MSDLSAADIAEGRYLLAKLGPPSAGSWWVGMSGDIFAGDGSSDSPLIAENVGYRDAQLIVWALNHLPALLDAAEKVRALKALHSPDDGGDGYRLRCCTECLTHWPCATSRAINTGEAR